MPKLTPFQWFLVAGSLAIVVVLILPNTPASTTSHPKLKRTTQTADANGVSYEDLNAHFPRYHVSQRNPFVPLVEVPSALTAGAPGTGIVQGPTSGWALTGINTVDGITNALVENSATNDSVFLHVGDAWLGMKVKSIDADGVVLIDAAGAPTRLSFVTTAPDTRAPSGPAAPGTPSVGAISPLPPMPIAANTRRGRRRGGIQQNAAPQPADDSSESSDQ